MDGVTKWFFAHGTSNSKRVPILMPSNLEFKVQQQISDPNGRYLILDMIEDVRFIILNIMLP